MHRDRVRKLAVRAAVVVAVLVASIAAIFIIEQRRTRADLSAVVYDLLRGPVLHEARHPVSGRVQIVLQREAQPPGTKLSDPTSKVRWSLLSDSNVQFPQASLVTLSSFVLNNSVPTDIRPELQPRNDIEFAVISRKELESMQPREFEQRFPSNNNWGYYALSQAGFNFSKTEAILYIDHLCIGEYSCAGGGYVLARKVDGVWRIVEQHSTWIY